MAGQHAPRRPDWLALSQEEPLDPDLPIVDAHIHLYDRADNRYLLPEILADMAQGHNIRASVYVQARAMYRTAGPDALKPLGESEFANGIAAQSASGLYGDTRLCAAIVPFADLRMGESVGAVLDAHMRVSDRICGIRQPLAWDPDSALINPAYAPRDATMSSDAFVAGFGQLARRGLSFDAWVFFHQLPQLADLAQRFPQVPIILNHCGGILGIGPYQSRQSEVYAQWLGGIKMLARLPNVRVKLGGMGMKMLGFGLESREKPASSAQLAELWQPYFEEIIAAFGADRCMFESNFPVDKGAFSYVTCWNAFKTLAQGASAEEKTALFSRTAVEVYRIDRELI